MADRRQRRSYRNAFSGTGRNADSFVHPSLASDDGKVRRTHADTRNDAVAEDKMMGFEPILPGSSARVGWLMNMVPAIVEEPSTKKSIQAVDLFFIGDSGEADFRATIISRPYMYVSVIQSRLREVEAAIRKQFRENIADVSTLQMEDISEPNHLASDTQPTFLKVECNTMGDLFAIRERLLPLVARNRGRRKRLGATSLTPNDAYAISSDGMDSILDIREYDVAPVNRLAIDKKINVGYWYRVTPSGTARHTEKMAIGDDPDINSSSANEFASSHLEKLDDIVERANPVVLAYDIECTKKPLKFPDADAGDEVMMISWMVDGRGFLVINREAVSADIEDFEYAPHGDFRGKFDVFNEPNEKSLLERFFSEVRIAAPRVFVTYNGDFFDWPFVEKRASLLGLDMGKEIGMRTIGDEIGGKETRGRTGIHMDVFHWVNRDSYLPQGSRGLKAVTRTLLGFEPEEIPPEEMMAAAKERPREMAKYSVSDAVCTYYLYMKYVHPFIFSLCNIIPLGPDDVLRKGSGTLCEMLLMCQARDKNIVAPNKFNPSPAGKLTEDGHVLESETYIGGHVEALRTGIYRSDLPLKFNIDVSEIEKLESSIDETLKFAISVEGGMKLDSVTNYDEVKSQILKELAALREKPEREEKPLIYHLDVSAMYPNIILTNRLQPHSIVTSNQCASCDFNGMSQCQREMTWTWRGEVYPATRGEAEMIQRRAAQEEREIEERSVNAAIESQQDKRQVNSGDKSIKSASKNNRTKNSRLNKLMGIQADNSAPSFENEYARKNELFRKRLKEHCRRNYRKALEAKVENKVATVCQRENPFYVDTVRAFRDRRYEYKALLKKQKSALKAAKATGDSSSITSAENIVILYDSLQLAHKCILNSFYGYVMRRGARWYSMEMAGVVTYTGASIIKRAREFIDKVGISLELDTDGIWCTLPVSFPDNFTFISKEGRKHTMSYIGSLFNVDVAKTFTNHQYQDLVDPGTYEYSTRSECSIVFEVDGPYRAMVLPASLEEGKSIKKRYAVFNHDGSLAELKGFEIKRRGELKLIKNFQGEVFKKFLDGESIDSCYDSVGATCNKWLDVLTSKGQNMDDDSLLELLVEQNNMSKPLQTYLNAGQKSCAITCAIRMTAILGAEVVQDSGLAAMYVIAKKPDGAQVTERAIPSMIFDYKPETARRRLLQKWTKTGSEADFSLRTIIDWEYYKGRLANAVLKIVSIPAALQLVENPVPRIEYPLWLMKRIREMKDSRKQRKISSFFNALPKGSAPAKLSLRNMQDTAFDTAKLALDDIEDMPLTSYTAAKIAIRRTEAVVRRKKRQQNLRKKEKKEKYKPFKSIAEDPETRQEETRANMLELLAARHPDKRRDYKGWVRYAKNIWRAQRAARVARYERKRSRLVAGFDAVETIKGTKWISRKRHKTNCGEVADTNVVDIKSANDIELTVDYLPDNFVADLRSAIGGTSTGTFFRRNNTPLLGHGVLWQVVAIAPSPASMSEFRLWVLPMRREGSSYVPGNLHCIPLHMNRVLYVSSKTSEPPAIDGSTVELVKGLHLPRSRPHSNIFRIEISEDHFRTADRELTSKLCDANTIDGVYGTRIPLEYEAIIALGTLCTPRHRVLQKMNARQLMSQGLQLHDIISKDPKSVPYLRESLEDEAVPTVSQAFLYGSHANDGSSRATYILAAPAAKIFIAIVVTPSGETSINLGRIWKKIVEENSAAQAPQRDDDDDDDDDDHGSLNYVRDLLPHDVVFTMHAFKTREEAWKDIGSALSSLRTGSGFATKNRATGLRTVVVAQWPSLDSTTVSQSLSTKTPSQVLNKAENISFSLEECIPAAQQFPIVYVSSNAGDGKYLPIGWETRTVTTGFGRFTEMGAWLPKQLALSRFAGIPVGNVSIRDVHLQALDVLIGRELSNNNHVLWASPSHVPDLGGSELDDNAFEEDQSATPEHISPGSYRVVCIDTELSNVAIATLLSSRYVNQLEGTDLAFDSAANLSTNISAKSDVESGPSQHVEDKGQEGEIGGKSSAPLDEMASSAPVFKIVRDLVTNWNLVSKDDSHPETAQTCNELLSHVHRWVQSESSLLHDPALSRFLAWLIQKVFRQLVNELLALGAKIVYASLSRLILATPKTKTIDGMRYAGFLEKTIKSKPLFRHISFSPILAVYSGVLFVDRFNYGALPSPEEEDILNGVFAITPSQNAAAHCTISSRNIPSVRMMWDMARYLPVPVAVLWCDVIENFIRRPLVQRLRAEEKLEASLQNNRSMDSDNDESQSADRKSLSESEKKLKQKAHRPRGDGYVEEVKDLVRTLSSHLLDKVQEIREKTPRLEFPNVPTCLESSDIHRRNPALEFVRTLCYPMSLDSACSEEISNLRRSLLQLLGVREFAKEAQFIDPSLPVPLRDVICSYCNNVVDLDLARDSRLWGSRDETKQGSGSWSCECCGHTYDVKQIELNLVRVVQKAFASYQVQDLICTRCRIAKRDNMSTHCSCSGAAYELAVPKESFKQQILSIRRVAEFHHFEYLLETTSWMDQAV